MKNVPLLKTDAIQIKESKKFAARPVLVRSNQIKLFSVEHDNIKKKT